MRRRVLYLSLALALLFQVSDLSRIVYVTLDLAPDCPVVGQKTQITSACCDDKPDIAVAFAHEAADRNTPTGESPRERSEKCPTCRMLATAHTFATIELPTPVLIAVETGLEQVQASRLPHLISLTFGHARAPPHLV